MEEIQNPQSIQNQPPVPNQQPVINTEPNPKKKGGVLKLVLILLVLAVIGGGAAWYFLGMPGIEEAPPSLEMGGSKFQGQSIGDQLGSLVYDETDVSNYSALSGANFGKSNNGVQYFYTAKNTNIAEITNKLIKPEEKLQILIAIYNPYTKCYDIYPKGPYANTCEIKDPNKYEVKEGRGFAIIGSKNFEYDSNVLKNAKTKANKSYVNDYIGEVNDWILLPVNNQNDYNFKAEGIVWYQSEDNKFEKVQNRSNPQVNSTYNMAWFKLGDPITEILPEAQVEEEQSVEEQSVEEQSVEEQPAQESQEEEMTPEEKAAMEEQEAQETVEEEVLTEEEKAAMEQVTEEDPSIQVALLPDNEKANYFGFENTKNPESVVHAFYIQPEIEAEILSLKTTWTGCATPNNFNTVSKIYAGGTSELIASDTNGDGDFSQNEFENYTFNKGMLYLITITGNTMNCESDQENPDILNINLDSIEWQSGSDTYEESINNITGDLIFTCDEEKSNDCIQEIGDSFDVVVNFKEGISDVRISKVLDSGQSVFGEGFAPNEHQAIIDFKIMDDNKPLFTDIKFKYNGCFGNDDGTPVAVPVLMTQNGFLTSYEETIAQDSNQNGIFEQSEFTNEKQGIVPFVDYVIMMETTKSCEFNMSNPDIGSVEFLKASPAHGNVNEVVFGVEN